MSSLGPGAVFGSIWDRLGVDCGTLSGPCWVNVGIEVVVLVRSIDLKSVGRRSIGDPGGLQFWLEVARVRCFCLFRSDTGSYS